MPSSPEDIRAQILDLVKEYHTAKFAPKTFDPDKDLVHYAGRVFDAEENVNLVDASLDFYLTANRASPIILLGKADLLKTISPLAKSWIIPRGVVGEVEKKRSIEPYLSGLSYNSKVIQESSSTTHPLIAAWD